MNWLIKNSVFTSLTQVCYPGLPAAEASASTEVIKKAVITPVSKIETGIIYTNKLLYLLERGICCLDSLFSFEGREKQVWSLQFKGSALEF